MLKEDKWSHKWGFKDSYFIINPDRSVQLSGNRYDLCKYKIPGLIDFVSKTLDLPIDLGNLLDEIEKPYIPIANINQEFFKDIKNVFSDEKYSFDDILRLENSHGQTSVNEVYKILYGNFNNKIVDMVFFPKKECDIIRLINAAKKHNICLIPVGGRTNVSNALTVPHYERRMIVAINMLYMDKLKWIDKENKKACFEAGITGRALEQILNAEGFTSGHEPDSYEFSTLGGWIATNCSGMKKNKYGNIEDIVETINLISSECKLSDTSSFSRQSNGIDLNKLIFGNEGNLGIITQATIKIHELPEKKSYASFLFADFKQGVSFMHDLSLYQTWPASVRLMDNTQFKFGQALKYEESFLKKLLSHFERFILTKIKEFSIDNIVVATVLVEGKKIEVDNQLQMIKKIAAKYNAIDAGEDNGKRGYILTFAIAYIRELLFKLHIFGETFETTVPWSKIHSIYNAVQEEAKIQHKKYKLPGKPFLCTRITQIYSTSVCMYFTYGFYCKGVHSPDQIFSKIEHSFRQKIIENGGSISHHHGIGKLRKDFVKYFISKDKIDLIKSIKNRMDPDNLFGINNNLLYKNNDNNL